MLFGLSRTIGQTTDSLHCDSNIYTILLNCEPTFNGNSLKNGDEINVVSNITDVAWQQSTINYIQDSLLSIPLEGRPTVDSSSDSANLEFSIYSFSENCLSTKVDFTTDNLNSTECVLLVNSFEAFDHKVELPPDSICTGNEAVALYTDIPDNNYTLSTNSAGLRINEKGEIVPRESLPGRYIVNVTSNYCLSEDVLEIQIFAAPDLSLKDTLPICRGESLRETAPELIDLQFYGTDYSETYTAVDIAEGGKYIAYLDEGPCASVDTVFVDIIDPPEIQWETQEECDYVIVRTNIFTKENFTIEWSNDFEGTENIVYNDTMLSVKVEDEFGCSAYSTKAINVNRLTVSSVDYSKEEADCWTEGHLTIDAGEVDNSRGNYRFQLYNDLTNQLQTNLDEVPEGVYTLQVVDDHGCVASYEQKVKVEQKCLEDYPAFSPDGDNIEDEYFIPHEGTVSIYNRDGYLLRELETPAYWDGTDAQNRPVPMGNYLLVTESGRTVNITIIR